MVSSETPWGEDLPYITVNRAKRGFSIIWPLIGSQGNGKKTTIIPTVSKTHFSAPYRGQWRECLSRIPSISTIPKKMEIISYSHSDPLKNLEISCQISRYRNGGGIILFTQAVGSDNIWSQYICITKYGYKEEMLFHNGVEAGDEQPVVPQKREILALRAKGFLRAAVP